MAEAILNALAEDAGLRLRAESAGVAALDGAGVDRAAKAALEEIGIYPGDHHARQVTRQFIEEADLVLTMSPRQSAELLKNFDLSSEKVDTLPAFSKRFAGREGIVDPHGQSMQMYRATSREILEHVGSLVDHAVVNNGALLR